MAKCLKLQLNDEDILTAGMAGGGIVGLQIMVSDRNPDGYYDLRLHGMGPAPGETATWNLPKVGAGDRIGIQLVDVDPAEIDPPATPTPPEAGKNRSIGSSTDRLADLGIKRFGSTKLHEELRSHLRYFAFFLANGSVCDEILDDIDYMSVLAEPSTLEMVFAIWANVIDVDSSGRPSNPEQAKRRVAQFIRSIIDSSYVVEPTFEPWECELY